jgi:predicted TPR repeat methyltransferase
MSTLKNKYKEQYILFLEAGFIAVNQMDEEAAIRLFNAAKVLNPHAMLTEIGFGYLHLCKLELTKAIQHFGKVIEADPTNDMAKTFLGIALTMTKSQVGEGEKILETLAKSKDKDVSHLSKDALDFVDRFVKKT